MSGKAIAILVAIGALLCLALPTNSRAADNPALNADILKIALDWEHIKFEETDKDLQEKQMAAVADRAAALVQQYLDPSRSNDLARNHHQRAGIDGEREWQPLQGAGFRQTRARDIGAARNVKSDPIGCRRSGQPRGSLLPGARFPVGFGDKAKARQLLQEAVKYAAGRSRRQLLLWRLSL